MDIKHVIDNIVKTLSKEYKLEKREEDHYRQIVSAFNGVNAREIIWELTRDMDRDLWSTPEHVCVSDSYIQVKKELEEIFEKEMESINSILEDLSQKHGTLSVVQKELWCVMLYAIINYLQYSVKGDGSRSYAWDWKDKFSIPEEFIKSKQGFLYLAEDQLRDALLDLHYKLIINLNENETKEILNFIKGQRKFDPKATLLYGFDGKLNRVVI